MDVIKVINQVHDAGIEVMANYIYGLPGDTNETIEKTFQLSLKLNTLGWNTYAAMALPGVNCIKTQLKIKLNYLIIMMDILFIRILHNRCRLKN